MPLTQLPVVSRAKAQFPSISIRWKGSDVDDSIGEINKAYIGKFSQISSVAAIAYGVACVEWIYWLVHDRLSSADSVDYAQYLMATWVWECGLPRKVPPDVYENENTSAEQRSVFNQAVEAGLGSLSDGIASVPDNETAVDAAFITQLCEYVLPFACGYDEWRSIVLDRLTTKFPADKRHYDDVRVARRLFDTDVALDDIDNDEECERLLADFKSEPNRYLPLEEPD
jgi:hypothetical protein